MDHNCPVCRNNLRWATPAAKMKFRRWILTYEKTCPNCGSTFEWNTHKIESNIPRIFLPAVIVFVVGSIIEKVVEPGMITTILAWSFPVILTAAFIYVSVLGRAIPRDWPRWRPMESRSGDENASGKSGSTGPSDSGR